MRCLSCEFYETGYMWNRCTLVGDECFMPCINCDLVHEDGSVNYDSDYFKVEESTVTGE